MALQPHATIGNSAYGPLFVRVALGGYFVLAGLTKLENPQGFIEEIQAMRLLPNTMSTLYGILLPYFEIVAGGLLIVGLWTTLAAVFAALMLASFILALGIFTTSLGPFNKDIILLAATISIMYTGAGAVSFDGIRHTSS